MREDLNSLLRRTRIVSGFILFFVRYDAPFESFVSHFFDFDS